MMIGFLGIFTAFIFGFSMRDFFTAYYYGKLEETYENYDVIMSVSPLGQTRFFSVSTLEADEMINDAIEDKAMFFEFEVFLEKNSEINDYVQVKASNIDALKKINHQVTYQNDLLDDEMIITESLASSMDLNVGDKVFIDIKDQRKAFVVVDIIKDDMLFTGQQIFIDKTEGLPFFLSALSPSLESLNPALLTNIYNKVYIDVDDTYDIEETIELIQTKTPYQLLTFDLTIDDDAIGQFIQRNITAFFMIISISLFAIAFVLKTTLEVYFNEKKQLYATIHILGGKKRFSVMVVMMEMSIFFIISFLIAIFLAQQIINYGLDYLGSSLIYSIDQMHILYALGLAVFLFILVVYLYFKKFYQVSDINSLNQLELNRDHKIEVQLGTIILLTFIYLILTFTKTDSLIKGYRVIFVLIVIIYMLIYAINIVFYFIKKYWFQKHQEITIYYHLKVMLTKTTFKHYIHLVFIAFLTILLLVFANAYMMNRKDAYQETYQVDLMVVNITKDFDDKYAEINTMSEVDDVSKAGLYQQVRTIDENQSIRELISIDPNDISTYFKTNIDEDALRQLNKVTKLYIILPDRYMFLYDYDVGDPIDIYVNGRYKEQTFEIAGFFEKQLGDLAFTNLHHIYDEENIYNILLVNATNDKNILKNELLNAYHQDLIKVIDVDDQIAPLLFEMKQVTNYITFILAMIIFCFIIALMNHSVLLYHEMKDVYARMIVLGINQKNLKQSLYQVFITVGIILLTVSILGYTLIAFEMSDLAILFGEYEPIRFSFKPIWLGGIILVTTFGINQWFYIFKTNQIDATNILKVNKL